MKVISLHAGSNGERSFSENFSENKTDELYRALLKTGFGTDPTFFFFLNLLHSQSCIRPSSRKTLEHIFS